MMIKITCMFILLVMVGACPDINPWHGRFIMFGKDDGCSYLINGQKLPDGTAIDEVRAYGLLQVTCSDCSYNVVSQFESCDDCIICAHNEGIQSCRSVAVPVAIASIISVIMTSVVVTIILVADRKYAIFHKMFVYLFTVREKKKDKRVNELTEMIQRRMMVDSVNRNNETGLYPDLEEMKEPAKKHRRSGSLSPSLSLIGLAIANTLGGAKACDDLMFLNSNGQMFRDNTLSESSNGLAILHVGSSLCLKFQNGSTESISLNKLTRVDRYEAIYKAFDFKIETKSRYSCLGSGLCWDEGSCNANSRLQSVGPDAYKVPNGQHGCLITPNLSSTHCTHEQTCIWYYWKMMPDLSRCDLIYELISSTIIARMDYTDPEGNIIPFSLSESNPMTVSPITAHVVTFQTHQRQPSKKIRKHGDLYMSTISADLNQAQPGLLGDMQVQLMNSSSFVYPTWSIQCSPDGSKVACNAPESGYLRSLKMDSKDSYDHRRSFSPFLYDE